MQGLTAPPRDSLTDAQVTALLLGDNVTGDVGCELLDRDLRLVEDISGDLLPGGSSLAWSADAVPFLTCQLTLSRELQWGTDLVRVYRTLTAGGVTARFNRGVFCLATPQRPLGEDTTTFQVTGYDRLYLLLREVGDTYSVSAGSGYLAAIADVIDAAGLTGVQIDGTAADKTLPKDMVWPLVASAGSPTLWLDIVNTLLRAVAYDPLWCDENGAYRSQPHLEPAVRPAEFTLTADDVETTIVGLARTFTEDQWQTPNRWVFVRSDASNPVDGDGRYVVVNQSDGPTSIDQRGLVWSRQFTFDAADQDTLKQLGDAQVTADRSTTAVLSFPTAPLPIAGHHDVLSYIDKAAGGVLPVQATAWDEPLDGSDMTWTVQTVGG